MLDNLRQFMIMHPIVKTYLCIDKNYQSNFDDLCANERMLIERRLR
jgi:hypothetical protein